MSAVEPGERAGDVNARPEPSVLAGTVAVKTTVTVRSAPLPCTGGESAERLKERSTERTT